MTRSIAKEPPFHLSLGMQWTLLGRSRGHRRRLQPTRIARNLSQ